MVVLDVAMFATQDATWEKGMASYFPCANYYLGNFDMRLNAYMVSSPVEIPISGPVWDRTNDFGPALLAGRVRALAHSVLPQPHGMPVIFCKFHRTGDAGLTVYTEDMPVNENIRWLNYVLINADRVNSTATAMLHEIIHAANYIGDTDVMFGRNIHDSDPLSIMCATPTAGTAPVMSEKHAVALRNAYFARAV